MEDMQAVSRRRMMDLERRVFALEERMRRALWPDEWMRTHSARENALVEQYGEAVDKTLAARILGVTRATVYACLLYTSHRGGALRHGIGWHKRHQSRQ